jgi:hypothetical protein
MIVAPAEVISIASRRRRRAFCWRVSAEHDTTCWRTSSSKSSILLWASDAVRLIVLTIYSATYVGQTTEEVSEKSCGISRRAWRYADWASVIVRSLTAIQSLFDNLLWVRILLLGLCSNKSRIIILAILRKYCIANCLNICVFRRHI